MLIEHIDAIARSLQRDVLYLTFTSHPFDFSREWDENPGHPRQTIINWLDKHDISWKDCIRKSLLDTAIWKSCSQ